MDAKAFFKLVVQMRKAQQEYFRCRTTQALQRSKAIEQQIDAEIKRVQDLLGPKQGKLFE